MIEQRHIGDEQEWRRWRERNIGASEAAAMFGLHPYVSPLELWAQKSGLGKPRDDTALLRRGRIMEPSVGAAVQMERPRWIIAPLRQYFCDTVARLGATPDFAIRDAEPRPIGLLQAKIVSKHVFDRHWTPEAPPFWIVLQLQQELMLTGYSWGAVAALIIDQWHFDVAIYEIEAHGATHERIRREAATFWRSVDDKVAPKPDYERDAELLALMNPKEQAAKVLDLSLDNRASDLVANYCASRRHRDDADAAMQEAKAELMAKLGDAERAIGNGWHVTWKTAHYKEKFTPARETRVLRVTDKRGETTTIGNEESDVGF
jgi:predicted phage-related endonuclease